MNNQYFTILIVKFYTLFNTPYLVFSNTYLTCVSLSELQLLYDNVPTRGAERWFFFTLRLDNCSCKSKR